MLFKCQHCGKPFKAELQYDAQADCQVMVCLNCGAEHEEIDRKELLGAPVEFRFALRGPGGGGGGATGDGGG